MKDAFTAISRELDLMAPEMAVQSRKRMNLSCVFQPLSGDSMSNIHDRERPVGMSVVGYCIAPGQGVMCWGTLTIRRGDGSGPSWM